MNLRSSAVKNQNVCKVEDEKVCKATGKRTGATAQDFFLGTGQKQNLSTAAKLFLKSSRVKKIFIP